MYSYATVFSFIHAVNAINNTVKMAGDHVAEQFKIVQQVRDMEQAIYEGDVISKKKWHKFELACVQCITEVTPFNNKEVVELAEYITQTIWPGYCAKKYCCSTLIMLSEVAQNDLMHVVDAYFNYRHSLIM